MLLYKYTLDKSSKKYICPKCNKKTFVKYIETETGNYLQESIGRCDRESNCNYHCKPCGDENSFKIVSIPKPKTSFHDYQLVEQSQSNFEQNNFIKFLQSIFSDVEVKQVIDKYAIGTSKHWNGATVFWQIDNHKKVRHGKVLQYHCNTGKRYKDNNCKSFINSVRTILKIKDFNLSQCLFGLQLIVGCNQKTIAIVESEKTAIIMSLFKPQYIWLATGGKGFLKYDMLLPVKQFKIIAFPDKGEYNDWQKKSLQLIAIGFKIEVNQWLENCNCEKGSDLADIYINALNSE